MSNRVQTGFRSLFKLQTLSFNKETSIRVFFRERGRRWTLGERGKKECEREILGEKIKTVHFNVYNSSKEACLRPFCSKTHLTRIKVKVLN